MSLRILSSDRLATVAVSVYEVAAMLTTEQITQARYPEDVFGDLTPNRAAAKARLKFLHRELAKQYHPDHEGGSEEVFKILGDLYEAALRAVQEGSYGQRASVTKEILISTRRHAYKVSQIVARGSVSVLYGAVYEDEGETKHALIKVVRDPKDGSQLANEATALKSMLKADPEIVEVLTPYISGFIEAFGYKAGGKTRQAMAMKSVDGLVTLEEVKRAYPDGVNPKDAAWMLRRLLLTVGLAHKTGWSHGQVGLEHVLIHPAEHGLVLVDWRKALPEAQWTDDTRGQDIADAIACMEQITNMEKAPWRLANFIRGCQMYPHRLPSALTLRDEYDELIGDLWGKRKFRPFTMPKVA